jgi:hypothetical protein
MRHRWPLYQAKSGDPDVDQFRSFPALVRVAIEIAMICMKGRYGFRYSVGQGVVAFTRNQRHT